MAIFNFDFTGQAEAKKAYYAAEGEAARALAELRLKQAEREARLNRNELNDLERATITEAEAKKNTSLAAIAREGNEGRKLDQSDREWNDPTYQQGRQAEVSLKMAQAKSYESKAQLDGITAAKSQDELEQLQLHRSSMTGIAQERGMLQARMAAIETASQNPAFAGQYDAATLNSERLKLEADMKALDTAEKVAKTRMVYAGIGAKVSDAALNYLVADAMGIDPLQMKEFAPTSRGGGGQSAEEQTFEYTQSIGNDTDPNSPKKTIKFKAPLSDLPKYDFGNTKGFSIGEMLPYGYQGNSTPQTGYQANQFMVPYTGVNPASTGNEPVSANNLFGTASMATQPTQATQPTRTWVYDPQTNKLK